MVIVTIIVIILVVIIMITVITVIWGCLGVLGFRGMWEGYAVKVYLGFGVYVGLYAVILVRKLKLLSRL